MLAHWPIRNKLLVGVGLLLVIVITLSLSGFVGVYAYRGTIKSLSDRSTELPTAAMLSQEVSKLLVTVGVARGTRAAPAGMQEVVERDLGRLDTTLERYRAQLAGNDPSISSINDSTREWATVRRIEATLARVKQSVRNESWLTASASVESVWRDLDRLRSLSAELPSFLHQRIHSYAGEVRTQYRALIAVTWVTTISAAVLLALLLKLSYGWVLQPLRVLIQGSRRVAAGDFHHRICLSTHDEISELADALNEMTARFQAIRDDLDRQVQERTRQVVRSEQLASVGFLAAGVAHEINNPLASIALGAESLESRIQEMFEAGRGVPSADSQAVVRQYLRMIQDEAFRCKGITERLLDFSRIGDVKRQNAELRELVQGVIDMVGHLGKYHGKHIELAPGEPVIVQVNPQEIKQVVLNLLTNGLDSLAPGGRVQVQLAARGGQAELLVSDNGCGMTDEVREHLFEPFFTRRRGGQGIGLGLSITYRIIADHGGQIDAQSDGPGKGSRFRVTLPLADRHKEISHRYQAA